MLCSCTAQGASWRLLIFCEHKTLYSNRACNLVVISSAVAENMVMCVDSTVSERQELHGTHDWFD